MPYCGREFTASQIDLIRELIALSPPLSRYRLSREVCERLNWRRADGRLKDMSCRVALLKMQADALFSLPPPRNAQPVRYREHPGIERAVLAPTITPSVNLGTLSVALVVKKRAAGEIVAVLGFGASAWKTKPRDEAIGWSSEQRQRHLHLVVNNARFLILPWITCRNLASRTLGLICRRLPEDWHARYAYRPVLLETFVEKPRFAGTCYKAANWQYLGDTQGRGKLDTLHRNAQPIKSIWVYPLVSDFRRHLCNR